MLSITFEFSYRSTDLLKAIGIIEWTEKTSDSGSASTVWMSDETHEDPEVAEALKKLAEVKKRASKRLSEVSLRHLMLIHVRRIH